MVYRNKLKLLLRNAEENKTVTEKLWQLYENMYQTRSIINSVNVSGKQKNTTIMNFFDINCKSIKDPATIVKKLFEYFVSIGSKLSGSISST